MSVFILGVTVFAVVGLTFCQAELTDNIDEERCHERIACYPAGMELACPPQTVMHIVDANYGRTAPDAEVCPYGRPHNDNTNCYASNSMSVVAKACEGQTSCSVPSGTAVFGDPCYGTYKYLRVNYCCDLPKRNHCLERTACYPKGLELSCPVGSAIHIADANYGRTVPDADMCPYGRPHRDDTNCHASKSMSVVAKACEGQTSCKVRSGTAVFGDPCYGTYKYLRVNYCCDFPKQNHCIERVACYPQGLKLECPRNSVIHVEEANYGRTKPDGEICPYGRRHRDDTTCHATNSMSVVTRACEGKSSCYVTSGTAVFGDPCYGTYKYLRVKYCCKVGGKKHV